MRTGGARQGGYRLRELDVVLSQHEWIVISTGVSVVVVLAVVALLLRLMADERTEWDDIDDGTRPSVRRGAGSLVHAVIGVGAGIGLASRGVGRWIVALVVAVGPGFRRAGRLAVRAGRLAAAGIGIAAVVLASGTGAAARGVRRLAAAFVRLA